MSKDEVAYTYNGWAEAFQIFAKYFDGSEMAHVAAEHDVIFAGPNPVLVKKEDVERLEKLHWFASGEFDCFFRYT